MRENERKTEINMENSPKSGKRPNNFLMHFFESYDKMLIKRREQKGENQTRLFNFKIGLLDLHGTATCVSGSNA